MEKTFDVVIVGAGMVGASFTCALLAQQPALKIALVEAFPLTRSGDGLSSYDARSTALSCGSANSYMQLGIWEQVLPHVTAISSIQVSDQHLPGATLLESRSVQLDALGYVVENRQLGKVLLDRILASNRIARFAPAQVTDLRPSTHGSLVRLLVEGEELEIRSALVVIADGTESRLREKLGIRAVRREYDQRAIIANLSVDRPHEHVAYERFTEQGPVALLPLQRIGGDDHPLDAHRFALILNSPVAQSDELMQLSDAQFITHLHTRLGYRAGRILRLGKRVRYDLVQSSASEQIRNGFVILGNAAHTLHPVAGQGFNLSLRDAICLADVLATAHTQGKALGSLAVLERYLQDRETDQMLVQQFTHGVVSLFGRRNLLPRFMRQAGLITMDLLPRVKNEFVNFAAGMKT